MSGRPNRCLWVEAGVLNFRLCPRPYRCDQCPVGVALQIPGELHAEWECIGPHFVETGSRLQELSRILVVPGSIYLANHLWLRIESEPVVSVGLDPLAKWVLGRLHRIELVGGARQEEASSLLLSGPVGQYKLVLPAGWKLEPLSRMGEATVRDWYHSWSPLLRVRFQELVLRPGSWYTGPAVANWLVSEVGELERRLVETYCSTLPGRLSTVADGGVPCLPPLEELHREAWFGRLTGEFISERNRLVD